MPVGLDLLDQTILALLSAFLGLLTLAGQEGRKLVGVPAVVWLSDVVLPILADKVDEVLAVGRSRIRYVVIRQPPLKLSLVPFVVGWSTG